MCSHDSQFDENRDDCQAKLNHRHRRRQYTSIHVGAAVVAAAVVDCVLPKQNLTTKRKYVIISFCQIPHIMMVIIIITRLILLYIEYIEYIW